MTRKLFLFIALIISVIFASAQTFSQQREDSRPYRVSYAQPQPGVHQITFEILNVSVDDVTLDGTTYSRIHLGNAPVSEKKGWAELPFVSASIQLPNDRDVEMEISTPSVAVIQLANPMVPSRGTIYRNQDPNSIPYRIARESRTMELYPENIATMESPFIVRDVRGTTVRVSPFRYRTNYVKDMSGMFYKCSSLSTLPDISKWNINNVENINGIFCGCLLLSSLPDISRWNTNNINNMSNMFSYCSSLISLPDISKWNTTNVINMSYMFSYCLSLTSLPDISKWNTENINKMSGLFSYCFSLSSSLLYNLKVFHFDISGNDDNL